MRRPRVRTCAAALAVSMLAMGCGGDDDGTSATTTVDGGGGGEASGVLRWGIDLAGQVSQDAFDPALSVNFCERVVFEQIYGSLLKVSDEGELQPGLAEEWELESPTRAILTLRDGLIFHNGDPFDAEAVKAGLEYNKDNNTQNTSVYLRQVETIEVLDERTVALETVAPVAGSLLYELAGMSGEIVHPSMIDGSASSPIGAGPFQLTDYEPGNRIVLERFADYYGPAQIAGIEIVNHTGSHVTAFRTGAIDFSLRVSADDRATLESAGGFASDLTPTMTLQDLSIRHTRPETENVLVRQAINHAIDREALREVVTNGEGELAWGPVRSGLPGYDEELDELYPYDPEAARGLLAEAGFSDGLTLELVFPGQQQTARLGAELIQEQLAEVGIEVTLMPAPDTAELLRLFWQGQAHANFALSPGSLDIASHFETKYGPQGQFALALGTPEAERISELVEEYRMNPESDEPLREANRIVAEGAFSAPVFFYEMSAAWNSDRVQGEINAPNDVCASVDLTQIRISED